MGDANRRGQSYELWATEFLRRRIAHGTVEHGVRMPTRGGGTRVVDVLVTARFPGLPLPQRMVVECKDWRRPVPPGEVGKLFDLMDDVGVPLGLLLTPVGFTAGAIRRAAQLPGITLEV